MNDDNAARIVRADPERVKAAFDKWREAIFADSQAKFAAAASALRASEEAKDG